MAPEKCHADLLLATDQDCDRVGIAVKNNIGEYELLTGNQTGLLLLDYICSQRVKYGEMPDDPVMVKTIVTMDMAEWIAAHYGLRTINVLTGFKFIGEQIGKLEQSGKAASYVFGFEESYGYLTGSYVRDKDGVDGAYMICEMFSYYAAQGISLLDKLEDHCSIVVRPSGTEPKLKMYISVSAENKKAAEVVEEEICESAEGFL